jgi:hypothetical protein
VLARRLARHAGRGTNLDGCQRQLWSFGSRARRCRSASLGWRSRSAERSLQIESRRTSSICRRARLAWLIHGSNIWGAWYGKAQPRGSVNEASVSIRTDHRPESMLIARRPGRREGGCSCCCSNRENIPVSTVVTRTRHWRPQKRHRCRHIARSNTGCWLLQKARRESTRSLEAAMTRTRGRCDIQVRLSRRLIPRKLE